MKKTGWLFLMMWLSSYNAFPQINAPQIHNVGKARQMHFENEDDFLTYIQRQYFHFVWEAALPQSGLSCVRFLSDDSEKDKHTITMGSSGFGIAGILVGIERGFITRQQGIERLERIAGFLERSDRFHGMWSHWMDDRTAKTIPFANPESKDNGGDIVESAFLAEGILCARQYLNQGTQKEKALAVRFDKLWKEMDWLWYYNETEKALMWHWSPNYGWEKNFPLRGYNECLIAYILGAASPTHPIPKEAYYQGWCRNGEIISDTTLYGFPTYVIHNTGKQYVGPIFWPAFSYVGFNPQGLKDELGTNYWKVNVSQASIQQAYCIANPNGFKGYGADCWGFSAGYSVKGYKAHNTKTDAGVITPSGTLVAMPYTPEKVMPALKHFYFDLGDELWGPYGFYDGYIADSNTVIKNYLANNQCAALPMIENYRTGLLWKLFMSAPEISVALNKLGFTADTNRLVISSPKQVEDVILRQSDLTYEKDNYWTGWNFGASQTLDIGYAIAMWNQWRGNVLIRFDLRGIECTKVDQAVFRIYKPRNITQLSGNVPIAVYRVKPENKNWREGNRESLPQYDAASWQYCSNGIPWAGGESGCGVSGTDYFPEPLGTAIASKYKGEWLEFTLPKSLVQSWIDSPDENAGLLIKVLSEEEALGDHVLFYSSEHVSGKGPQLVIEGTTGKPKTPAVPDKKYNARYVMPPQGKAFQRYVDEVKSRYPLWIKDTVVNLQGEQKIYPYYWDIVVDGEFVLPYSYYPLSQSIPGIDALIEKKDTAALKNFQKDRLRWLHLWEYVREQRWYDCGDIIEFLSPLQAAYIWLGSKEHNGLSFDGILYKIHPKGMKNLMQEEIQLRRANEVIECIKNLDLTESQFDAVSAFISEQENLRCIYYNKCNEAAQRVHELLALKNNGNAMIDALGEFMNYHDVYLFYDSYWQMQRWTFLMDHTDQTSLNRFWKKQKYGEYSPERIKKRFEECRKYWPENRPALDISIKNKYW